jgi:hypothetical protein
VFDGVDDYFRTSALFTNARTNITMTGWVYVNLGTTGTFLSNGDDGGGYCIGIGQYFSTADNQIVGLFGTIRWILTGAYYQYTGWHHVVMTLDGSGTPSIYVNGVLIGTYPGSIANIPSPGTGFAIASQWGIRFANMKCGNANFYNRELTAAEIQQNYQATKDKFLGQDIVTSGLVLNLDAANKDSYPGTGTTWYDLSGNGYNGTLTNGTSFVSNIYGGYFNFDGVDDYVDLQYAIIGGTGDFTVNQWIQADASETGGTTFGNYPAGTLQIFYGTTYMGMWLNNSSTYVDSPVPFSSNPVMITTIRSGTTTYFYQNGILLKTGSSSANIGAANFRIGTNTSTSEQFTGRVFVTQTYNRALSVTEIQQNYNATKTRFGI